MNEQVWSADGTILAGDNRSTGKEACPSATLFITSFICTGLGLNLDLCSELGHNHLSYGMATMLEQFCFVML